MANVKSLFSTFGSDGAPAAAGAGGIGAAGGILAGLGGPLGLAALGLSALGPILGSIGGPPGFYNQKNYPLVDPRESLTNAMESTFGLGKAIQGRLANPTQLVHPIKAAPAVHIPGLPFEIGAGTSPSQGQPIQGLDIGATPFGDSFMSPKTPVQRKKMAKAGKL